MRYSKPCLFQNAADQACCQIFTSYVCMDIYLFISRNETKILVNHKIKHFLFFGGSGGSNAARIASSNTFFNPFCVSAEHSTYLTARSSLANFSPTS